MSGGQTIDSGLNINYDLEIGSAVEKIQKSNAKTVLIQLPDGLKQYADKIEEEITAQTKAKVFIWAGSCFGACDVPKVDDFDLLIQWGHSEWR